MPHVSFQSQQNLTYGGGDYGSLSEKQERESSISNLTTSLDRQYSAETKDNFNNCEVLGSSQNPSCFQAIVAVASMAQNSESNAYYGSIRSIQENVNDILNDADDELQNISGKAMKRLQPITQKRNISYQENTYDQMISEEQTTRRENRHDLNFNGQNARSQRFVKCDQNFQIDSLDAGLYSMALQRQENLNFGQQQLQIVIVSESNLSSPQYKDSLESKLVSPRTSQYKQRRKNSINEQNRSLVSQQQPSEKLKVQSLSIIDLKDKNNYMPVALHPTKVVENSRNFQGDNQNFNLVEDSIQSSLKQQKSDSNYYDVAPSFRQPDFPFQSDNLQEQTRHQENLKNQQNRLSNNTELVSSMTELKDRNIALQSRIGNLEDILRQQLQMQQDQIENRNVVQQKNILQKQAKMSWEDTRTSFVNTEEYESSQKLTSLPEQKNYLQTEITVVVDQTHQIKQSKQDLKDFDSKKFQQHRNYDDDRYVETTEQTINSQQRDLQNLNLINADEEEFDVYQIGSKTQFKTYKPLQKLIQPSPDSLEANPYKEMKSNHDQSKRSKTPSQLYDQASEQDNAEASVININESNIEGIDQTVAWTQNMTNNSKNEMFSMLRDTDERSLINISRKISNKFEKPKQFLNATNVSSQQNKENTNEMSIMSHYSVTDEQDEAEDIGISKKVTFGGTQNFSESCERCQSLTQLNQAVNQENERLRQRLEHCLSLIQRFESERQDLKKLNDSRIDALEQTIEEHRQERNREANQTIRDQAETIKCLKDHITQLERINFQNEVSAVNLTNITQSNFNASCSNEHLIQEEDRDIDLKVKVQVLEQQLRQMREIYGVNIQNLEQSRTLETDLQMINQLKAQYQPQPYLQTAQTTSYASNELTVGDKQNLYEKLAFAEQDLDCLTRELHLLRLENSYLQKVKAFGESNNLNGFLLVEKLYEIVARAFKDERIYNLLDLRAIVCLACELAKKEHKNDLVVQDKLYQVMEQIITKLQSISELEDRTEYFQVNYRNAFGEFIENSIQLCTDLSQQSGDSSLQEHNLHQLIGLIDLQNKVLCSQLVYKEDLKSVTHQTPQIRPSRSKSLQNSSQVMHTQISVSDQSIKMPPQYKKQNQSTGITNSARTDDVDIESDFSDEDYTQELEEERIALRSMHQLLEWSRQGQNIEKVLNIIEKTADLGLVSIQKLFKIMNQLGFHFERRLDSVILAKYIFAGDEKQQKKQQRNTKKVLEASQKAQLIEYTGFVENLQRKPFSWWQDTILNNSFSFRTKGIKQQNSILNLPNVSYFFQQSLAEKMTQEHVKWKRFSVDMLKQSIHFLTKQILRKFSKSLKVPLTRLETVMLLKLIQNPQTQKKEQVKLAEIIKDPLLYLKHLEANQNNTQSLNMSQSFCNSIQLQHPSSEATFSKKELEQELKQKMMVADCKEIITRIQSYLKTNQIFLNEWLQAFNADNSSLIKFEEISKLFTKLQMPVSRLEQRQLFNYIDSQANDSGRESISISDLMKIFECKYLPNVFNHNSPKFKNTYDQTKENENCFANSIIKLEEQYNAQKQVDQSVSKDQNSSLKQRPEGSKINELKRKIERMQQKVKISESQSLLDNQNETGSAISLSRRKSTSQERGTQTAVNQSMTSIGNQFKRRSDGKDY